MLLKTVAQIASLISIEIQGINRETIVGNYTAELMRTEFATLGPVVIENQLRPTVHSHVTTSLAHAVSPNAYLVV